MNGNNGNTVIVSINILSKYSSVISHRCSKVDTSTIDLRWSTHQSPIFEGRHIDHRSSKVNTSISEGRHIVTSIFEGRHIDLRKSTHRSSKIKAETSHLQFVVEIVHNCAVDEITHAHTYMYKKFFFNIRQQQHARDPTRALVMY